MLERACHLTEKYGGGSMTALPIIETQAGDVSAYIPTNVISITDGQIYLENDLFFAGQRPAVNVGLSVSRVGGAAQTKAVKKTAGTLRIDLARFRELEVFTQFSSDLDKDTRRTLAHGKHLMEILKQPLCHPLQVWQQAVILYVATSGLLSDVPLDRVNQFVHDFADSLPDTLTSEIQSTALWLARQQNRSVKRWKHIKSRWVRHGRNKRDPHAYQQCTADPEDHECNVSDLVSKLRKARQQLNNVEPYFLKITSTISDILHRSPEIEHIYFDKREDVAEHKVGFIVITGDKGLAGAYNHNVLRLAEEHLAKVAHPTLFLIGQTGRSYFAARNIPIDGEFMYTRAGPDGFAGTRHWGYLYPVIPHAGTRRGLCGLYRNGFTGAA